MKCVAVGSPLRNPYMDCCSTESVLVNALVLAQMLELGCG